jgi:hypothetical protein
MSEEQRSTDGRKDPVAKTNAEERARRFRRKIDCGVDDTDARATRRTIQLVGDKAVTRQRD